ncbi:exosortase H [Candidatus Nitrotoga sp. M5]|uniref:exosortase H n=1 Tax=Candidatus Nitrotoga sp. M5 TaxID=2890409 RepID=UPI001EF1A8A2|nr:exosortase H [Candidatus Nitrotoga sp. M5]CAH1386868.1 Exosortase H, IPTLxxWG-CTERM-specific [Candidatus Nitrotoga sp. M5]
MLRFLIIFLLIMGGLFALELTPPGQALVHPWATLLARFSATLITLFDPKVISYGNIIQSQANGFAVAIEAGCNAVEACIVLAAAILAFPSPWRHKILGLVLGMIAVQALNILRIISLFYLGQWRMDAFEFAHLYLWQGLIMLDVLVVWLIWIRTMPIDSPARHVA